MKNRPEREGILLCYPVDEGRLKRLGEQFFLQPKYKGDRMHVEWFHNQPIFISSYGNEFPYLDHLKEPISRIGKDFANAPFDGEIYRHGWGQERINAALRTSKVKHPDNEFLQFHIFDIAVPKIDQTARLGFLLQLAREGYFSSELILTETILTNQKDWLGIANSWVEEGYEGAVLRKPSMMWRAKRDVGILKFKPTETDEYKIVAINEAIDKYGTPKGMVGSFDVTPLDHFQVFSVSAGKMKHNRRREVWNNRQLFIGATLIVKHEKDTTAYGVPVCAVAVEIKEKIS